MQPLQKDIVQVLKYFAFFQYPPTFEELHTFLSTKLSQKELKKILISLEKEQKILVFENRYTTGEYQYLSETYTQRRLLSQSKLLKMQFYFKLLASCPFV